MRMVVYTVLVGQKEELNNPLCAVDADYRSDLDLDFVCFTDNPALTSPTWTFRAMPARLIPPNRLSRLPKAMPNRFFAEYDYSFYIDNTVAFRRLPQRADLAEEAGAVFRAFRHPWRSNPQDEADIIVRSGLDEAESVARQTLFYDQRQPLHTLAALTAGTALLRRHHDPRVVAFGELWWEQILLFSPRDQISLDQCAREASCPIHHFPGTKTDSDLIAWPVVPSRRRVEATFDADRYAWEHRGDPDARRDPRGHYLAHGEMGRYDRLAAWFRYCCLRALSGLTATGAPRRNLADILEPILVALAERPGPILVVGIASGEPYAAAPEELTTAQEALTAFFRFRALPPVVTAAIADDDIGDPAPFRQAHGIAGFRLVVVIGLSPHHHANALGKFLPLLDGEGTLLVQFGASLSGDDIRRMRNGAGEPCDPAVLHGGHIATPGPIPSSVFLVHRRG